MLFFSGAIIALKSDKRQRLLLLIVKMQNICNLIGWNSVHISDIFNCYRANTMKCETQES